MLGGGASSHVGSVTDKEPTGSINHVVANATRPSTVGLPKSAADEFGRFGITINTVAPGWIETEQRHRLSRGHGGSKTSEERQQFLLTQAMCQPGGWGGPARSPR
ncbi:SDR family oxidoreductase [Mycobacterium sp. MUNTM1]